MAYSQNPSLSTYSTKRLDLVTNPQQRSGLLPNKDARLVNVMSELLATPAPDGKKFVLKSRPGLTAAYTVNAGEARGLFNWLFAGVPYVFSVVGNKVYVNGVDTLTLTTSTGLVGFAEHVSSVAASTLVLVDGIKGYVFTNSTTYTTMSTATPWALSTAYLSGDTISPSVDSGFFYTVSVAGTSGGTEPTWVAEWAASTVEALNALRAPSIPNTFFYKATAGGTTGTVEPNWPVVLGGTVVDGSVTWTCEAGTIVDGGVTWTYNKTNFPSPHLPFPIFLDGYIFLAKADTQDVYNSNLDDPKLWTAGDYFSAEMYPDKLVALSKNNNYIYAIGSNSVEYLYDDAVATGSPLGRHQSAVQQFGCPAPGTVVPTDQEVFMIGQTAAGGYTVWSIEGFKEKELSIPAIRNVLLAEGAALVNAKAYSIRVASQKFYIICLSTRTLAYSLDTQIWSEWASGATSSTAFIGTFATDGPAGTPYILNNAGGTIYKMSENVFTDNGAAFRCEIVTEKHDFESVNRKWMSRLAIVGDVPDATGVDNSVSIEWSDDDYVTWSTARNLSFNYDFPVLRQLGSFRRRAFRLRYSLPHLIRFEGLEVDINKGSQ